jgi:hypothetical protein
VIVSILNHYAELQEMWDENYGLGGQSNAYNHQEQNGGHVNL